MRTYAVRDTCLVDMGKPFHECVSFDVVCRNEKEDKRFVQMAAQKKGQGAQSYLTFQSQCSNNLATNIPLQ